MLVLKKNASESTERVRMGTTSRTDFLITARILSLLVISDTFIWWLIFYVTVNCCDNFLIDLHGYVHALSSPTIRLMLSGYAPFIAGLWTKLGQTLELGGLMPSIDAFIVAFMN